MSARPSTLRARARWPTCALTPWPRRWSPACCSAPALTPPHTMRAMLLPCAAAQIEAGLGEAYLCIGVESMTMVPQGGFNFSPHPALYEHSDAYISMGETAENVAQRYAVTRADQEALAVASHRKAAAARDAGRLQAEIVPITPASGDMV